MYKVVNEFKYLFKWIRKTIQFIRKTDKLAKTGKELLSLLIISTIEL